MFLVGEAAPAPPWRRNATPVPIIHVRRRWLAQRHWQCECHWPASNKWGVKSSFSCLWWQNLTKLPNLYQKPMDSKLCFLLSAGSSWWCWSRPPLRSFHAKGWSKCSPHRGFPQKTAFQQSHLCGFVGWLQLPCPYPPPRSLALVRRAVHALVEGRKAGKNPYQNQGLGKSFSSFGRLKVAWVWLFASVFNLFCHSELSWLSYSSNMPSIKINRLRFLLTKFTLFFKRISHFQTSHFRSTVLFGLFHWTKGCLEKKTFFRTCQSKFFSAWKKFQKSHMLSNKMFKNWLLKPPSPSESWPTEEGGQLEANCFDQSINTKPQVWYKLN